MKAAGVSGMLPLALIGICAVAPGFAADTAPSAPMPYAQMAQLMQMDDSATVAMLWLDQLELRRIAAQSAAVWQAEGWYGSDYNKLWMRSEGETYAGRTQDARVEMFWDHIVARWWNLDVGARQDLGIGPQRSWAALGIRGLAVQGFAVEATVYAGDASRTAVRLKIEYELLFTQRLILQSEAETNFYGEADPERRIGSGPSDLEIGLRLRYEIRREWAPYVGLVWARQFGATAALWRAAGGNPDELQIAVGLRVWL